MMTRVRVVQRLGEARSALWQYVLAAAFVGVAYLGRIGLEAWVGQGLPLFVTFYPAIMLAALLGGVGPGLAATALSAGLVATYVLPVLGDPVIASPVNRLAIALFCGLGLLMTAVAELFRRNRVKKADIERAEALRESEEQLRLFVENAPVALAMFDQQMRYVAVSQKWLDDYRPSSREILGRSHYEVFPEIPERWKELHCRGLAGEVLREEGERFERADGSAQWVRWEIRPWHKSAGAIGGIVIFAEDITDRKRIEQALQVSEERLRFALDAARAGAWSRDLRTDALTWSEGAYRLYGVDPSRTPLTHADWEQRIHPEDLPGAAEAIKKAISGQTPDYQAEFRVIPTPGTVRWLASIGRVEREGDGVPIRLSGINLDVTARKEAEEVLAAAHRQFQAILDNTSALIYAFDLEARFILANAAVATLLKSTPAQLVGKRRHKFMPRAIADRLDEHDRLVIETGKTLEFEEYSELKERPITWLTTKFPLRGPDGQIYGVAGISADITERKQREDQIGLLMREVNHRAKNLLAIVQSVAFHTARTADPNDFANRFSDRIQALAANQDLLVNSQWLGVELSALVRVQLAHFQELIGRRVTIDGPPMRISPSAAQCIGMALHELATNAGKYGALSNDAGKVQIVWSIGRDGAGKECFYLDWTESGGPSVQAPTKCGFGTTVISVVPKKQLKAEVIHEYEPTGVSWSLTCPAGEVIEQAGAVPGQTERSH